MNSENCCGAGACKETADTAVKTSTTSSLRWLVPRADVVEKNDAYLLTVDLPGVLERNLDIKLEKNELLITGTVEVEPKPESVSLLREFRVGNFRRSFTLNDEIDRDNIQAELKDGVLTLRLSKSEAIKPRKIQVKEMQH